jgi:NAD-dependent dihydropyrimidine dehydrogenase PreA subunit
MLALQGIAGNMIVLSWLYERAARWTLDRFGVRGLEGLTLIKSDDDDEEDGDEDAEPNDKTRVIDTRPVPQRRIYCVDLRVHTSAQPYIDEIKRIARENAFQLMPLSLGGLGGSPSPEQLQRFAQPTNDTALPITPVHTSSPPTPKPSSADAAQVVRIEESLDRRWYPVIDYSRCTNCMECIDFCLFGVYGVDKVETILVEQPDNCRKGCPACSRVCPENAIIFPQHKTPTIAGAPVVAESLKIDLSKLFGAPETGETAEQAAIRERDEQLLAAGREAVGSTVGLPKRHAETSVAPKDDLDSLLDALDDADL